MKIFLISLLLILLISYSASSEISVKLYQTLDTYQATQFAHTELENGDNYLAVSNYKNQNSYITIYKWIESSQEFLEFQKITGLYYSYGINFGQIEGIPFFAVSNSYSGSSYSKILYIYKFNGAQFEKVQTIGTYVNYNVDFVNYKGNTYLGVSRYGGHSSSQTSYVYIFDKSEQKFVQKYSVSGKGAQQVHLFEMNDNSLFLVAPQYYNSNNFIYRLNEEKNSFETFQTIACNYCRSWKYYRFKDEQFLVGTSDTNYQSMILQFNDSENMFVQYKYTTKSNYYSSGFELDNEFYVFFPTYYSGSSYKNIDSPIYKFDQEEGLFQASTNIKTNYAFKSTTFKIKQKQFVAVPSYHSSYDSNIYAIDLECGKLKYLVDDSTCASCDISCGSTCTGPTYQDCTNDCAEGYTFVDDRMCVANDKGGCPTYFRSLDKDSITHTCQIDSGQENQVKLHFKYHFLDGYKLNADCAQEKLLFQDTLLDKQFYSNKEDGFEFFMNYEDIIDNFNCEDLEDKTGQGNIITKCYQKIEILDLYDNLQHTYAYHVYLTSNVKVNNIEIEVIPTYLVGDCCDLDIHVQTEFRMCVDSSCESTYNLGSEPDIPRSQDRTFQHKVITSDFSDYYLLSPEVKIKFNGNMEYTPDLEQMVIGKGKTRFTINFGQNMENMEMVIISKLSKEKGDARRFLQQEKSFEEIYSEDNRVSGNSLHLTNTGNDDEVNGKSQENTKTLYIIIGSMGALLVTFMALGFFIYKKYKNFKLKTKQKYEETDQTVKNS